MRRIFAEARKLKLPEPKIEEIGMRLRFTVYLAEPHQVQQKATEQVEAQVEHEPPTQSTIQSNDPVQRLLQVLADGPLSSGELRNRLNLKHPPTFRTNYRHPALADEYIEMTIPDKPNSRLQKYRLTEKGKSVLEGGK